MYKEISTLTGGRDIQYVDSVSQKLHGEHFAMKFYGNGRVVIYADGASIEFATKGYIVLVAEVYGEEAYQRILGEFASKEEAKLFIAKEVEKITEVRRDIRHIKEYSTGTVLELNDSRFIYTIRYVPRAL